MRKSIVDEAEAEARRFLDRIDQMKRCAGYTDDHYGSWAGDPYTAAVRRSSMDLTRALANLRRG